MALGLFDGIHVGHRAVLDAMLGFAAEHGLDPAVFSFDLDAGFPAGKRGMTRLLSDRATTRILEELGVLHLICPPFSALSNHSPAQFADLLTAWMGAKAVFCGYDFRFGKRAAGTAEQLRELGRERGFSVHILEPVCLDGEPISSRSIRARITAGDLEAANRMLGAPFSIDFPVTAGRKLGRKLGWPTINQPFPDGFTIPRFGVYATLSRVEDAWLPSVTNVGIKPTVGSEIPLAETYIQGFSGDLYDRRVEVQFLQFLRPEQKFPDLETLKEQIRLDAEAAVRIATQEAVCP